MSDNDNDPITLALRTRRIPHGRNSNSTNTSSKGKGKSHTKSSTTSFDPLRTLGHYTIHLGSSAKRARKHNGAIESTSWLEMHELTVHEDGLLGTFGFDGPGGRVQGMCVLAGSRRGLSGIVAGLEEGDGEDEDDEGEDEGEGDEDGDEEEEAEEETSLEASDAKLNARYSAFEKNSFRNPKFWLRWKGHVQVRSTGTQGPGPGQSSSPTTDPNPNPKSDSSPTTTTAEDSPDTPQVQSSESEPDTDMGYVVFANNTCDKFDGTISCERLGWDNLKMSGWKTRSRATPCSVSWTDL